MLVDGYGGRYFLIAWDELRRFHVPRAHRDALTALGHRGQAPGDGADLRGPASGTPASGANALLDELVAGRSSRRRLAARRLSVWALLR